MTDHTITASFNYTATSEGLHGFLDTVLDAGALNGWCEEWPSFSKIEVEQVGGSTWITSMEVTYPDPTTDHPTTTVLDHDLIATGASKLLCVPHELNPEITAGIFELASENRLGEADADQVNYILQMAIFGELVYD